MKIVVTKHASGYFSYLEEEPLVHGAGSTPRLSVERLLASSPERFGQAARPVDVAAHEAAVMDDAELARQRERLSVAGTAEYPGASHDRG